MARILFDTDVIIDYLRGNRKAVDFFETFDGEFNVSAITIAELYSGVKGEQEREELNYFLSLFTVIPVTGDIAAEGGLLRQKWHGSHGMGLADALIAATASSHKMKLISLNEKHFGMLGFLSIPYRKKS
jgi:predicted nucleic acid-binding protein